ncbi:MAG: exodeoxyribonuclease VII small subunit [Flavobacteriales bacterium]|nr:exodeoxyribonuclease VII small subunit [Flavobacteriales bacterium]
MKKELTFDKAFNDLAELVEEIEDDEIKVDTLAAKVKQANELIKFCETKLRTIKTETTKLRRGK